MPIAWIVSILWALGEHFFFPAYRILCSVSTPHPNIISGKPIYWGNLEIEDLATRAKRHQVLKQCVAIVSGRRA